MGCSAPEFHIISEINTGRSFTEVEVNSGGYLPSREVARLISTTFTDTEVNNCFIIYHTSCITSGSKSNFICENIATKAILFSFGCSQVNST